MARDPAFCAYRRAMPYLDPTRDAGRLFVQRAITGPVVMLNLLRFREIADYAGSPEIAPPEPISGLAAYRRYLELARPFVEQAGGELVFLGRGGPMLIGTPDEHWDAVLLVRQRSVADFMSFATNQDYAKVLGHRTAALADSRLLPMIETDAL
jgi:uncharacterized protein (DUF1330 family)